MAWEYGTAKSLKCMLALATAMLVLDPGATSAKPVAPVETQPIAGRIWDKLLARCGESYFYVGSLFDGSGMLSDTGAGQNPDVIEYRGVKFNTVPVRITDAEKLNGLTYHARISMMANVYRTAGESWSDGPGLRARNVKDIMGLALQSVVGNLGELGNGGAMAFDLLKVKGTWAIARSGVDMSGPLTFDTNYYDAEKLITSKQPRPSCTALLGGLKRFDPSQDVQAAPNRAAPGLPKPTPVTAERPSTNAQTAMNDNHAQASPAATAPTIPFAEISQEEFDSLKPTYGQSAAADAFETQAAIWKNIKQRFFAQVEGLPAGTQYLLVCQETQGACENGYTFEGYQIVRIASGTHAHALAAIKRGQMRGLVLAGRD